MLDSNGRIDIRNSTPKLCHEAVDNYVHDGEGESMFIVDLVRLARWRSNVNSLPFRVLHVKRGIELDHYGPPLFAVSECCIFDLWSLNGTSVKLETYSLSCLKRFERLGYPNHFE